MNVNLTDISSIVDNAEVSAAYKEMVKKTNAKIDTILPTFASMFDSIDGVEVESRTEDYLMIFIPDECSAFANMDHISNTLGEVAHNIIDNISVENTFKIQIVPDNKRLGSYVTIKRK